jgi:hypothetical protein
MIEEKDILFVTTSMNNKWSYYSRQLVSKNFPNSEHLIVDGTTGWWQVWFKWIELIKNKTQKYVIHLDDDAFITNKDEILNKEEYEKGFIDDIYIDGIIKHKMSHNFCDLSFSPWTGDIFYPLFWSILENGYKIKYIYPNYGGKNLESTNPSIEKGSPEFLIHMWFTREWNTEKHINRYNYAESILINKMNLKSYNESSNNILP